MGSDYKGQHFAKVSGTLIEELGLLTRAVFVVDEKQQNWFTSNIVLK